MTRKLSEHPHVRAFLETAMRYCEAIETGVESTPRALFEELEILLPQLIADVLRLPIVRRPGPMPPDDDRPDRWRSLCQTLATFLGEHRRYWAVFDPASPQADDPMVGDLADDLADIYCDLRRGLDLWETADPALRREILWRWRFDYESHWGQHAVDALRTVYAHLGMLKLGRSTLPA